MQIELILIVVHRYRCWYVHDLYVVVENCYLFVLKNIISYDYQNTKKLITLDLYVDAVVYLKSVKHFNVFFIENKFKTETIR